MDKHIEKYQSEELKEISLAGNINGYKNSIIFIFSFLILAVLLGSFIKYPEKIIGKAFIVSENQINNIYSPNSGEVILIIKENTDVEKGDLLALINSPTNYQDLIKLKDQLSIININSIENSLHDFKFDKSLKLGEIEKYYYNFLLSMIECDNTFRIDLTKQKIANIKEKAKRNNEKLKIVIEGKTLFDEKSEILAKAFEADSTLFTLNAIIKDKIDDSKLNILNSKEKKLSIDKSSQDLMHYNEELKDETFILEKEKEKSIASTLFNLKKAFFELKTAIDFWEHNYTIKAPVSGKIEFYQPFFNSTQFVKKDSPLFILLPKANNLYARGIMSANGYGKIKTKDTVFIKLKDYPYKEYGELKGIVFNKSKVYHDTIYYVDIKLPKGLKTNHDKIIDFSYNMPGQVEYYTNKRSILQRIFSEVQNSLEK
ncbi:HlyD family efflux transporter periplasmic adaptor subunit [Flavobacterium sp.]|uniref:HlyD family efflux transporter periplasmic adaptor subunit n=1 Tax=Flavobacterium sp. TaxID=239 RepID=UPI003D11C43B